MIDVELRVALTNFETPASAIKFIRLYKNKNETIQTNMLWVASENRSNTERTKCKIVNKLKKYMVHFRRFQIRHVVTKKWFKIKVDAHVSGKILPVGSVTQICYLISFNGETSTVQTREGTCFLSGSRIVACS